MNHFLFFGSCIAIGAVSGFLGGLLGIGGGVVSFLLSSDAAYVTGADIAVDGGLSASLGVQR